MPAVASAIVAYKLWLALGGESSSKGSHSPPMPTRPHETEVALSKLVQEDGAGCWPPRASHGDWPSVLLPYHEIYLDMVPILSSKTPSLDDDENKRRRAYFRAVMLRKLREQVNLKRVEELLLAVEANDWQNCSRAAYNGFYCCIGVLRHSYRWGVIPSVKVAQEERIIDFPSELELPWASLQRKFGVDSDSGSNTSNVLHNYNEKGERAYKINVDVSDLVTSTEDAFFRIFYDVEVMVSENALQKLTLR